jgi:hypothetical protein
MADFEFVRCGLNAEHPEEYDLSENPERPGTYQWEALDDDGARELIVANVEQWVDTAAFDEVRRRELWAEERMKGILKGAAEKW